MREATAKQSPSQSYYSAHEGSFNLYNIMNEKDEGKGA